jgi:hypothetical protein
MSNREPSEQDVFRAALGPGKQCLSIEELEQYVSEPAMASADRAGHIKSCAYCQTELELLQTFQAGEAGAASAEVQRITEQLRQKSNVISGQSVRPPSPWWKTMLAPPRLVQASLAMAALLVVAGIVLQFRPIHNRSSLNETNQTGQEVFRSGSFAVLSPVGNLQERPGEVRWEKVPKAAHYRVRVLEVDQSEVWKAETTDDHMDLPSSIRVRILPAKTLFCEVSAFDSSGNKIGETGLVRFRLVQNVDRH